MPDGSSYFYPQLTIQHIQNPNRFFAIPLLGFFIKCILVLPICFEILFLAIFFWIVLILNAFVVLFTGKYWDFAYMYVLGFNRLNTKVLLYLYGLSNKYPGFNFSENGDFTLQMPKPVSPSRLYAFPFTGLMGRVYVMYPFFIYSGIISVATWLGTAFIASFSVLFRGKYPDSIYELTQDTIRLQLAQNMYFSGFSDLPPSMKISMTHKGIKLSLIILGILFYVVYLAVYMMVLFSDNGYKHPDHTEYNRQMQKQMMDNYNNNKPADLKTGY